MRQDRPTSRFAALLAVLLAYCAGLIALGLWLGHRVQTSGSFFVGDRSLGAGLMLATFLAPNIGIGSTLGATDLAYDQGFAAWWWNGSAGLGSFVLAFWIGPRLWREATRLKLLTVGDFLEHHFGLGVRALAGLQQGRGEIDAELVVGDGRLLASGVARVTDLLLILPVSGQPRLRAAALAVVLDHVDLAVEGHLVDLVAVAHVRVFQIRHVLVERLVGAHAVRAARIPGQQGGAQLVLVKQLARLRQQGLGIAGKEFQGLHETGKAGGAVLRRDRAGTRRAAP